MKYTCSIKYTFFYIDNGCLSKQGNTDLISLWNVFCFLHYPFLTIHVLHLLTMYHLKRVNYTFNCCICVHSDNHYLFAVIKQHHLPPAEELYRSWVINSLYVIPCTDTPRYFFTLPYTILLFVCDLAYSFPNEK